VRHRYMVMRGGVYVYVPLSFCFVHAFSFGICYTASLLCGHLHPHSPERLDCRAGMLCVFATIGAHVLETDRQRRRSSAARPLPLVCLHPTPSIAVFCIDASGCVSSHPIVVSEMNRDALWRAPLYAPASSSGHSLIPPYVHLPARVQVRIQSELVPCSSCVPHHRRRFPSSLSLRLSLTPMPTIPSLQNLAFDLALLGWCKKARRLKNTRRPGSRTPVLHHV
jgi:hypothetical protein